MPLRRNNNKYRKKSSKDSNPLKTKDTKGFWEYSNNQKIVIEHREEEIKRNLRFLGGFNPKKVDDGSLVLATLFYSKKKELCQVITQREMLEHMYFYTMVEWATDDIKKDWYKHRQFSKVLYALAKGLKVVNVYNHGKSLYWKSPTARATFTH